MDRFELRRQDFSLDEDQKALQTSVAEFFAKQCPTGTVRAAEPLGFDEDLWRRVLDLGVASMSLPEARGGDDATLVDLVLIAEELGRAVAPVPLVGHAVATRLLARAGASDEVLAPAARGDRVFALAPAAVRNGRRQLVPDAAVAADVLALSGDKLALHSAAGPAPHVANQGSTPLAWWAPDPGQERVVLAVGDEARDLHRAAVAEWRLLTAAALVGLTEAALHLAVEFAKTRRTMGVPIGTLQGVAFPLADVAIAVSGARNLVWKAAWLTEHEPGSRPELPLMAFDYAVRTATHGTTTSAHMQGGLGFTAEADASLYFLRAKGWSLLAVGPGENLQDIGDLITGTD
ncbi:acyl-CoA dehydrogenase family protein [Blastococcus sp. CT_GayMR16]|uniref:acyl-CoA dehydrogenase family protein n=1 Tax=Blastococcus sp. CT_GayMR16 TaxID=2559607 RepID=UPI00107389E9|nr:acyl-CoA dehydrogenase family protein [Blastococcus sp. CT_GayMR16]TFV88870.1 acyl-CoA dehydrogenase [Blastococcus sp. CT_GayMR16]